MVYKSFSKRKNYKYRLHKFYKMPAKKVPVNAKGKRKRKIIAGREKIKSLKPLENKKIACKKDSKDILEARHMATEIFRHMEEIGNWSRGDADRKAHRLFDRWKKLCSETKTAKSKKFVAGCQKMLDECNSFHDELISKLESFTGKMKENLKKINEKAGNDEATSIYVKGTLKIWNGAEKPRLLFLYDKTDELESNIIYMMERGIAP